MKSLLTALLFICTYAYAQETIDKEPVLTTTEMAKYESESVEIIPGKSSIYLKGYTQNKKWNDLHDLVINYSAIISINGFKDEEDPKISITSSEKIIENGISENRIYWVALKNREEVQKVMEYLFKVKDFMTSGQK